MIKLTERQEKIVEIVRNNQPITASKISKELKLTRSTLRVDLSILTMSGILGARPKVGYYYNADNIDNDFNNRVSEMKVSKYKSVPVVANDDSDIYDVIVMMFLEDVGSVFITSEGFLAGVVSRKDLLVHSLNKSDTNVKPVGMIMTRMSKLIYVKDDESILDAANKLIEYEVDSLPVVEAVKDKATTKYLITGRITKTTITNIFVEIAKE